MLLHSVGTIILVYVKALEFYCLEKILYFLVFLRFPDQIGHCDSLLFIEQIFHKLFNFLTPNILCDWKYFEAGTASAVHHEFKFDVLQEVNLVEIEHVEQDYIKKSFTSYLIFNLCVGKNSDPSE